MKPLFSTCHSFVESSLIAYSPLQIKMRSFSLDEGYKKENITWKKKKAFCAVRAIVLFSHLVYILSCLRSTLKLAWCRHYWIKINVENENLILNFVCSSCHQNLKCGDFTFRYGTVWNVSQVCATCGASLFPLFDQSNCTFAVLLLLFLSLMLMLLNP